MECGNEVIRALTPNIVLRKSENSPAACLLVKICGRRVLNISEH